MGLAIQSDLEDVDWEQLASVYIRAFNGIQTADLIQRIFCRSYATRIALWNGRIVGGVYAFSDGELDATVHGLCVDPDYQKMGIGSALLDSLLEEFGPHIAVLLTAEATKQPMYRKFGFKPLKTAMAKGFPEAQMEP